MKSGSKGTGKDSSKGDDYKKGGKGTGKGSGTAKGGKGK